MIEQTAIEADPNLYVWILKSVTEGSGSEKAGIQEGHEHQPQEGEKVLPNNLLV